MDSSTGTLIVILIVAILIWLAIRSIVLWYFRIDRIVELLEQIEYNTRSAIKEEVYYSRDNVLVTSGRVSIPPKEWLIAELRPVKVESSKGRFKIRLLARDGRQVHEIDSESEEKVRLFAAAINRALGINLERNDATQDVQFD